MIYKSWLLHEHCFLVIFCFILVSPVVSQENTKRVIFEAILVDQKSGEPVVFANVINPSRNWWVVTDTAGRVKIPVYLGDTLKISSLGYNLTRFIITDSILHAHQPVFIELQEKKYEIARLSIYALGTYEDFKYRVLHMKTPDKLLDVKNHIKLEKDKLPQYPMQDQMAISLGSPITAIYNIFSKEAKSRRKLNEAIKNENIIKYAEIKYNRSLIGRITGLKDTKLDEFILKYRPETDYLLSATEYDVIGLIIQDFEYYKDEQDRSSK
jgi:hypothetical protein